MSDFSRTVSDFLDGLLRRMAQPSRELLSRVPRLQHGFLQPVLAFLGELLDLALRRQCRAAGHGSGVADLLTGAAHEALAFARGSVNLRIDTLWVHRRSSLCEHGSVPARTR